MPDRAVRVAVTGAAGRLGSRAVALLVQRGHSVVAIDRRVPTDSAGDERTNWRAADLTDYGSVLAALEGCDALVHLAAFAGPGHAPAWAVHHNNVMASYNALHAAAWSRHRAHLPGVQRQRHRRGVQPCTPLRLFPRRRGPPELYRGPRTACPNGSASSKPPPSPAATMASSSPACGSTCASRTAGRAVEARRERPGTGVKDLWGYVSTASAAGACLLAIGAVGAGRHGPGYAGHEAFLIVAPDHVGPGATGDLAAEHYPGVPVRGALGPTDGFFNCAKAERLLGWRHEEW